MSKESSDNVDNKCFLQVSIAGGPPQRIIIQLFRETCPKTCQNFAALCSAPGRTTPTRPVATYRGSIFHRIVPSFMVQGGDFEHFSGTGGYAIASSSKTFADESFAMAHDKAGMVSMANKGKDTNGSQFFITLQKTPHLNQKHVVFGQVIEGLDTVLSMATDVELEGTKPTAMQKIIIMDCGMGDGVDDTSNKGRTAKNDDSSDTGSEKDRSYRKQRKRSKEKKSKEKRKSHKGKKHSRDKDRDHQHKQKKKHKDRRHSSSKDNSDDNSSTSTEASSVRDRKCRRDDKDRHHHKRRKRSQSSSKLRRRDHSDRSLPSSESESSDDSRRRSRKHKR